MYKAVFLDIEAHFFSRLKARRLSAYICYLVHTILPFSTHFCPQTSFLTPSVRCPTPTLQANMGLKGCCKGIAPLATAKKMVFNWGANTTHISNVVKTPDVRIDVHRNFESPSMAIGYLQVNKNAKDPGAKEFLREATQAVATKQPIKSLPRFDFPQVNFNEMALQVQLSVAYKYTNAVADLPDSDSAGEGLSSQAATSSAAPRSGTT